MKNKEFTKADNTATFSPPPPQPAATPGSLLDGFGYQSYCSLTWSWACHSSSDSLDFPHLCASGVHPPIPRNGRKTQQWLTIMTPLSPKGHTHHTLCSNMVYYQPQLTPSFWSSFLLKTQAPRVRKALAPPPTPVMDKLRKKLVT